MGVYVDERQRRVGRPRQPATDAAILEATIALMSEGGREAATIDAISARSRAAKTTIYRRWASVDQLFLDALLFAARGGEDFPAIYSGEPLEPMLRAEARSVMRAIQSALVKATLPTVTREMLAETALGNSFRESVFRPIREERRALLQSLVAAGEIDPTIDVDLILDLVNGAILYRAVVGEPLDDDTADAIAETVARAVSSGNRGSNAAASRRGEARSGAGRSTERRAGRIPRYTEAP